LRVHKTSLIFRIPVTVGANEKKTTELLIDSTLPFTLSPIAWVSKNAFHCSLGTSFNEIKSLSFCLSASTIFPLTFSSTLITSSMLLIR
jgi:hypothetical protein